MARTRDDHPPGKISVLDKFKKIFAVKIQNGRGLATDRPAQRMVFEKIEMEQIMHVIIGRILRLGNLLKDNASLALDLFRIKSRMEKDIGQEVDRKSQVLIQDLGVVTSVFLGGKRVQHAPDRIHLLRDLSRGAPLRPFK